MIDRRLASALLVLALVVAAMGALAAGAGAAPPVISVPPDITAEATSPAGADVSYTASAVNSGGNAVDLTCTPPGATATGTLNATATFPLGDTTVTCTVVDSTGVVESSATFVVHVVDTTAPQLTLPADITVAATSADGATVAYAASASDLVDGPVQPACTPASGSLFPVATTTVDCTAVDSHGNTSTGSFTVTVTGPSPPVDTTPPTFSNVPGPLTVEATGPQGAAVHYTVPTATDSHGEPVAVVTCAPAPDSTFSLGTTTVRCSATDTAGNTGTTSFPVTIVDTTPPTLSVPGHTTVQASASSGLAASSPAVVAFLNAAVAHDLVDTAPTVTNDAPAQFPVGDTIVTFRARDDAGNTTTKASTLTVVAPTSTPTPTPAPTPTPTPAPVPVPTPSPSPVATPPPTDARGFSAKSGRGRITLRWILPTFANFDHVELLRAQASNGIQMTLIYRGHGRSYVDRRVQDGASYRYEIVAVSRSGDRSAGVALTAFPLPLRLLAPIAGARLHAPVKLRWLPTRKASYYNVQLYRGSVKVMSTWPAHPRLQVGKTWRYLGRKQRFAPGTYRWYVWAGFGPRAARKYSPLLGTASFTVTP